MSQQFPVIPITFLILLYIFRHGAGTIGNAMYSSSFDDPYITNHVESDDEEREDFEIKPDDNLVAIAKINKACINLSNLYLLLFCMNSKFVN